MSKFKKNLLILAFTLVASACTVGLLFQSETFPFNINALYRNSGNKHSVISYHLADDASKGEITDGAVYTVTDPATKYYYTGYVSKGVFSSSGLALVAGEFFQADLKGGSSVQISFSSGAFAIELSNDNSHFSSGKYLSTNGTYTFHTLMRYVRVLCKTAGTLTDVNIGCECAENYTVSTALAMDDSAWTSTTSTNKYALVGLQKGSALDDFNYLNLYGTRTSEGLFVFVHERAYGGYLNGENNNWWENDNFEISLNTSSSWNQHQLYASTLDTDHGNFDIVTVQRVGKKTGYDRWYGIKYKCFVSYETLSSMLGSTITSSTDLYIWFGSASGFGFDKCSTWESTANMKITSSGIVSLSGNRLTTDYVHDYGGWDNEGTWTPITNELVADTRYSIALDSHAAIGCDKSSGIGDVVWRTTLPVFYQTADHGKGRFFRMDWCSFGFGGWEPDSYVNGSMWEYDSRCAGDNTRYRYYECVTNGDVVYTIKKSGNLYSMATCIFPNDPDLVGRSDYVLEQSLTTSVTMGVALSAEFANYSVYIS